MSEQNKPVVKKSNILELLEQGKTRKQISEHYDLTMGDVRKIFNILILKVENQNLPQDLSLKMI